MNIFYLHHDPRESATYHVDKHCVKMILEYAQLLSTAHRVLDGKLTVGVSKNARKQTKYVLENGLEDVLYLATHVNHPSAVWVRQSDANYAWLFRMFGALLDEYTYRYKKNHATGRLVDVLSYRPKNIVRGSFTEPTPCMPDQYKVNGDSIQSYRNYYVGEKNHMFSWKNRNKPAWIAHNPVLL